MRSQTSRVIKKSTTWCKPSAKVLTRPVVHHQGKSITTSVHFVRPTTSSFSSPQPPPQGPEQPTTSIGMHEWDNLSAEGKIQWLLNNAGDAKWGLVVYRTCYRPELDAAWENFKSAVVSTARQRVAESDAPDIANKMDWARAENPSWDIDGERHGRGSRYSCFIQVDEAALLSMAAGPDAADTTPSSGRPYVNIVRGWEDAENVEDWMKIQTDMLDADFYVELDNDEA
ncbi:hypothetical protein E8E14_004939 [Neopestalotiopsis sp. 37M]|nr:hypothetical protein E8E14_004939 [Neopestalotiopsis sp. 37M]